MSFIKEFKEFTRRGNILDMAIGVIIGISFGKIVSSLVNDVIMPPIGLMMGGVDFSSLKLSLGRSVNGVDAAAIRYGLFINSIIEFVIIALTVFLVVKMINRLQKPKTAAPAITKECPECLILIPLKAKRCGHCTSVLPPVGTR